MDYYDDMTDTYKDKDTLRAAQNFLSREDVKQQTVERLQRMKAAAIAYMANCTNEAAVAAADQVAREGMRPGLLLSIQN